MEDLKKYASANGLVTPATGEFCFSKALHGLIRDNKIKLLNYDRLEKDAGIFKSYMEKLAKDTKPFRCALGSNTTVLECYQCQNATKENPNQTPPDIRECLRNKELIPLKA
jgi:hypothetical protein